MSNFSTHSTTNSTIHVPHHQNTQKGTCGVRKKYARPWHNNMRNFQLYTTYSKPGLYSIFYNEDQRSFHNWGLELGSGPKPGRIHEAIDHQINTPVLEIAGHHNGSVYMQCPPDPKSTINVNMPYVTMLMRDMHGYSSVEFQVLDSQGFSRKIHAKNFKSRCTIGELNCEIPMRLSPTWNYACINLDETLRCAFGTKLVSIQRIKINANVRVRRIYFHEEIYPFKSLPQEFRIKLMLTPQERQEILMYEEFLYNEPSTSPEREIPWCMPKLMVTKTSGIHNGVRMSMNYIHSAFRRRVEIMEVPSKEEEATADKYVNTGIHTASNSGLLREMLQKSIPSSKILLPTLSLIYPDKKIDDVAAINPERSLELRKGSKKGKFMTRSSVECEKRLPQEEEKMEWLRKMKQCIEHPEVPDKTEGTQDKDKTEKENLDEKTRTDWEIFHPPRITHERSSVSKVQSNGQEENPSISIQVSGTESGEQETEEEEEETAEEPISKDKYKGCGKYTVSDLVEYVKHREIAGDYDLFNATLGNKKYLVEPIVEEIVENVSETESTGEAEIESPEMDGLEDENNKNDERKSNLGVSENILVLHAHQSNNQIESGSRLVIQDILFGQDTKVSLDLGVESEEAFSAESLEFN